MKHLLNYKLFENQEISYDSIGKFYHASPSKNLESLKKGINAKSIDISTHAKSQGGGFYVWNSLDSLKKWTGRQESADLIIEFQAKLNNENFEIDYELHGLGFSDFWSTLTNIIISDSNINIYIGDCGFKDDDPILLNFKKIDNNNLWNHINNTKNNEYPFIIISKSNEILTENDISLEESFDDSIDIILKSSKNVGWMRFLPFAGGDQKAIHQMIESLKDFGIKDKFKKSILNKCKALKYTGPTTYPTNYWSYKNDTLQEIKI